MWSNLSYVAPHPPLLLHIHLTRAQNNLYMIRPKHEYARYCIRYNIPLIVNESPPEIINNIDTDSL